MHGCIFCTGSSPSSPTLAGAPLSANSQQQEEIRQRRLARFSSQQSDKPDTNNPSSSTT